MNITLDQYLAMEDEAIQERYSNGECWKLAYALNEISAWPIMAVAEVGEFGLGWVHVLNEHPDGMYIDIKGEHDMVDVWNEWGELLDDPDCEEKEIVHIYRADFQKMLHENPKEIEPDTYAVAKAIYETFINKET